MKRHDPVRHIREALSVDFGVEDVLLLALWALCLALCLGSGYGFDFGSVFGAYLRFFGAFLTTIFVMTRIVYGMRTFWRPRHAATKWALKFMGGPMRSGQVIKNDLVLGAGILLLVTSLTFYSNIKSRIPVINGKVYDDDLIWLDSVLFGDGFAPFFENLASQSEWWRSLFEGVYFHGYVWMVILTGIFLCRDQRQHLMWLVKSVCLTYIVAVLWTTAYPTYGPFFFDMGSNGTRFEWMQGTTKSGGAQVFLMRAWYNLRVAGIEGTGFQAQPFTGIAALPSLHIGHMIILSVVARRTLPLYAGFILVLASLTFAATIAFGWHYGVDAIAGLMLGVAIPEGIRYAMLRRNPHAFEPGGRPPAAAQPSSPDSEEE